MKSKLNLTQDKKTPWHTHHGKDYIGIILTALLVMVIAFSVYAIKYVGFLMLIFIIPSLFGIACIRYARINLYADGFEIVKKCLVSRFSDRDTFLYKEIKRIEFSTGATDWNKFLILASMGKGSYGGSDRVAIPDKMIIETRNNDKFIFLKFGSKSGFMKTIELINHYYPTKILL
jgi:hypothetical protein